MMIKIRTFALVSVVTFSDFRPDPAYVALLSRNGTRRHIIQPICRGSRRFALLPLFLLLLRGFNLWHDWIPARYETQCSRTATTRAGVARISMLMSFQGRRGCAVAVDLGGLCIAELSYNWNSQCPQLRPQRRHLREFGANRGATAIIGGGQSALKGSSTSLQSIRRGIGNPSVRCSAVSAY